MKQFKRLATYLVFATTAFIWGHTQVTVESEGIWYEVWEGEDDNTACIINRPDGKPYEIKKLVVPDVINYNSKEYKVSSIKDDICKNNNVIDTVVLGSNLSGLYSSTFANSSLRALVFSENENLFTFSFGSISGCRNLKTLVFKGNLHMYYDFSHGIIYADKVIFEGNTDFYWYDVIGKPSQKDEDSETDGNPVKRAKTFPTTDMTIDWGNGTHILAESCLTWFTGKTLELTENTIIDRQCFLGADNITTLVLGERTRNNESTDLLLHNYNFLLSEDLRTIICNDHEPWPIGNNVFNAEIKDKIAVYVPKAALDKYKNDPQWGTFNIILPIENSVETISSDDTDVPVEYYDLNGTKIVNPLPGSIVICRQGSEAKLTKIQK